MIISLIPWINESIVLQKTQVQVHIVGKYRDGEITYMNRIRRPVRDKKTYLIIYYIIESFCQFLITFITKTNHFASLSSLSMIAHAYRRKCSIMVMGTLSRFGKKVPILVGLKLNLNPTLDLLVAYLKVNFKLRIISMSSLT